VNALVLTKVLAVLVVARTVFVLVPEIVVRIELSTSLGVVLASILVYFDSFWYYNCKVVVGLVLDVNFVKVEVAVEYVARDEVCDIADTVEVVVDAVVVVLIALTTVVGRVVETKFRIICGEYIVAGSKDITTPTTLTILIVPAVKIIFEGPARTVTSNLFVRVNWTVRISVIRSVIFDV